MTIQNTLRTQILKRQLNLLLAGALLLGWIACGSGGPEGHGAASAPAESPAAAESPTPSETEPAAEVTYEPAYPEEVSEDGLSEDDKDQQEDTHSHGDGTTHSHGDEGDHSHGDSQH